MLGALAGSLSRAVKSGAAGATPARDSTPRPGTETGRAVSTGEGPDGRGCPARVQIEDARRRSASGSRVRACSRWSIVAGADPTPRPWGQKALAHAPGRPSDVEGQREARADEQRRCDVVRST